jgi:hypothetical protein
MKLPSNTVFGCILASWTDGLFVHPDMTFQGDNGGGFATIPAGQYDVHPARGAVVCRPYDTTGGAVDWSAYTAYRATYSLLNPSSIAATYSSAVVSTEAQTVQEQDFGFAPFDPVTGQLNMTTRPANQYLVGDFLSLGDVGTRPKDANTGTGIWGDKTGLYGLSAATQEVIFSAATGKIVAGGGEVTLDKTGLILDGSTGSYATSLKWYDAGNNWNNTQMYGLSDATDAAFSWTTKSKSASGHASIVWTVGNDADLGARIYISSTGATGDRFVGLNTPTGVRISSATGASDYLTTPTALLNLNQAANDDYLLKGQSTDVAHGMTDDVETDVYVALKKQSAANGCAQLVGYSAGTRGFHILARHTTDNTTKTTAADGAFLIDSQLKSGTGVTSVGADGNLVVFRNNGTARFIFDAEGSGHADVSWVTFDTHDDLALLNLLNAHLTPQDDPLKANFGAWLTQSRDELERLKLVTFGDDGHNFINLTRMHMLEVGAIRQMGERLERLERSMGV